MERNIVDFIESHVTEVADLAAKYGDALWRAKKNGRPADRRLLEERSESLRQVYANRENYARVRTYDDEHLSNEEITQRQIHLMRLCFAAAQIPDNQRERMDELVGEITQISHTYRVQAGSRKFSLAEVREVLASSQDKKLRKALWLGARGDLGEDVGDHAIRLVGVRNRTARDLGYANFFHMSLQLQEVDENNLTQLLNRLITATEEDFVAAKAELDSSLKKRLKLRTRVVPPWMYGDLFFRHQPSEKKLGFDKFFAGKDAADIARAAFASMGFDVEQVLSKSNLQSDDTKNVTSICIQTDRRRRGIRIHANLLEDEASMALLLGDLGRAMYYEHIGNQLPYLLKEPCHPLILDAIALMFAEEVRSPVFLRDMVKGNKSTITRLTNLDVPRRRLDRLLSARWLPMIIYFERAIYEDPGRDMCRIWWDLASIFQHLEEPAEAAGKREWASLIALAEQPAEHQNVLLRQLIASQIREALEEATGSRDLTGNEKAGEFLVDRIFSHGATFPWTTLVERATGRPLGADSYLAGY